jgi:hypothetical protein
MEPRLYKTKYISSQDHIILNYCGMLIISIKEIILNVHFQKEFMIFLIIAKSESNQSHFPARLITIFIH